MTGIQPRFEFRIWGERLDDAATRLRALSRLAGVRESRETYVVVAGNDSVNPKVRAGLLDVKVLVSVERGFEQWDPTLKTGFPVSSTVLDHELFPRLGVTRPVLARQAYTFEEFIDEVVAPHPELASAEVTKRREAYVFNGCMAEIADVVIAGHAMQTVAIESEDLDALASARRAAGLEGEDNVSYPRAIKERLGWAG